eukprot:TRINITY_DN9887_c0_g2_i1.p1 TRINITY_DN9887_c0_g2~~TRINITY_DN9887_c0_g2_i1.p1  ORF type:complete len:514 (-),score=69.78 TRINITY_DN9887_c0_g2_i1:199-1740(-)
MEQPRKRISVLAGQVLAASRGPGALFAAACAAEEDGTSRPAVFDAGVQQGNASSVGKSSAVGVPAAFDDEARALSKADVLRLRKTHFSAAQSVSYANTDPLLIVRGEGSRLYDDRGRTFLDTRNNVCHVGHSHPRVAEAVSQQVFTLNTNTRYLHPNLSLLGKRLIETFPANSGLEVCFLVNSGSEANDLAMRLAMARTDSRDVVVVDHGYHGHTVAAIDISPYKYDKMGHRPARTHKTPCPCIYRGAYRGPDAGLRYAEHVADACRNATDGKVAAFFVESGMSVGGVILPPPGYLQTCYAAVRAAGGVCVADEVQVGFGRFGDHFWAFEQQGVIPDIVTMGKPFGNGMPLAAVVTTREIAQAFEQGVEYFNTFGGNPVCCAAGLAVLEVIRQEGLQENAKVVGEYLRDELRSLQEKHTLLGDIRGAGLFVGIEFVRCRNSLEPATAETSEICARMKDEYQILTSIDGPFNNVIVMKPPMCFSTEDVQATISALDQVITTLDCTNLEAGHTPT